MGLVLGRKEGFESLAMGFKFRRTWDTAFASYTSG